MSYELKRYSFGQTIGKGFNLYFENFLPIALVSLLCEIPIFFPRYIYLVPREYFFTSIAGPIIQAAVFAFATLFANGILSAFIVNIVSNKFLENSALEITHPLVSWLTHICATVGLSFLVGLLTILAGLACVIPGIIVSMGLSVAIQVYIIEKRPFLESIRRSWELTNGNKGEVFGLLFIMFLFTVGTYLTLSHVIRLITTGIPRFILGSIIFAVISPVKSCIVVLIYFNLRIEKEGFNIEHLVQQFSLTDVSEGLKFSR